MPKAATIRAMACSHRPSPAEVVATTVPNSDSTRPTSQATTPKAITTPARDRRRDGRAHSTPVTAKPTASMTWAATWLSLWLRASNPMP
jgi:hypothetical protein